MALSIRNQRAETLARELAERRHVSMTQAIAVPTRSRYSWTMFCCIKEIISLVQMTTTSLF